MRSATPPGTIDVFKVTTAVLVAGVIVPFILICLMFGGWQVVTHYQEEPLVNPSEEKRREVKENAQFILDALIAWKDDHGYFPGRLDDVVPDYLEEIPRAPWGDGQWRYSPPSHEPERPPSIYVFAGPMQRASFCQMRVTLSNGEGELRHSCQ